MTMGDMPHFLVEIHMADAGALELERAVRMLEAAQDRLLGVAGVARPVIAGRSAEDGLLICLIEAADPASARRTVGLALLPAWRIREVSAVVPRRLSGPCHPRSDADPGPEAELVEDVVDVGLDGPLGEE
jgi:hypothetical protein